MSLPLTVIGFPTPRPWRMLAAAAGTGREKRPGPAAPAERGRVEHDEPSPTQQTSDASAAVGTAPAPAAAGPGDAALVRAAATGDRSAFHALVDRHSPGLFRVARSLSRNRADAEDVLQETFVGAFRGLKNFDGRASVKTWLTRICVRQAARHWHGSRRSRQALALDGPAAAAAATEDQALSTASAVPHVDRRLDLGAVIQTLADDHREVIVLREVRGLSYDEIAAALNVPRGTVESRLHRARAALRQKLNGYGVG